MLILFVVKKAVMSMVELHSKGASEERLVEVLGPPTSFYVVGDTKYLTYDVSESGYRRGREPTYTTTVNAYTGTVTTTSSGGRRGRAWTKKCNTTYILSGGVVKDYRFEGNACVFKAPG